MGILGDFIALCLILKPGFNRLQQYTHDLEINSNDHQHNLKLLLSFKSAYRKCLGINLKCRTFFNDFFA